MRDDRLTKVGEQMAASSKAFSSASRSAAKAINDFGDRVRDTYSDIVTREVLRKMFPD